MSILGRMPIFSLIPVLTMALSACHTGIVEGYTIEGHVPPAVMHLFGKGGRDATEDDH